MAVFPSAASRANNLSYLIKAHPSLNIVTAQIVYCNVQYAQSALSILCIILIAKLYIIVYNKIIKDTANRHMGGTQYGENLQISRHSI